MQKERDQMQVLSNYLLEFAVQNNIQIGIPDWNPVQYRVAAAAGYSVRSVQQITKEAGESENVCPGKPHVFKSPRKKLNMPRPRTDLNHFEEEIIRKAIYNFAEIHKRLPTMKSVYEDVKSSSDVQFDGKHSSFRNVVIKKYREEGRNIIYTDETYLHSSHVSP